MEQHPQIVVAIIAVIAALVGAGISGACLLISKQLDSSNELAKLKIEHERQDLEWLRSELVKTYSDAMSHLSKLEAISRFGGDLTARDLQSELGESQGCILHLMAYATSDGERSRLSGVLNALAVWPQQSDPKEAALEISRSARGGCVTVQSVMEADKRIGGLRDIKSN